MMISCRKILCAACAVLTAGVMQASDVPENFRKQGTRLNNLVKRMKVVKKSFKDNGAVKFTNPRHGWLWVKTTQDGTFTVKTLSGKGADKNFTTWNNEGFVRLEAGEYQLSGDWGNSIQINSVPTLIYSYLLGKAEDKAPYTYYDDSRIGVFAYNYPWLKDNVLASFNVMAHNDTRGIPEELKSTWCTTGRLFYCQKGQQDYKIWEVGMTSHPYDGLQIDEFVTPRGKVSERDKALSYTKPGLGFDKETLGELKRLADKYPDFAMTPWLGMNWDAKSEDNLPLWQAVSGSKYGGVMYEAYMRSRDWKSELEKLTKRIAPFNKFAPYALDHVYYGFGLFTLLDDNAAVDYKVLLDMAMQKVATDPEFNGLGGLGLWASYYAHPEILRWYARLLRHYALEGNTDLLSKKYNFPLMPGHLTNPMWESLDGWNAQAAEAGSLELMKADDTKNTGVAYGYWPKSTKNLLKMAHVPGKVNRVSQRLKKLEPGKEYMLHVFFTGFQDNSRDQYDLEVKLDNVKITDVMRRQMNDWLGGKCYNSYRIRFVAGEKPVTLTIADPVRNVGAKTILIDGVSVTPYFSGTAVE